MTTMRKLLLVGAGFVTLLSGAAPFSQASLSADRPTGRIAYSNGNICLVNADASGKKCLTRTGIDFGPVSWSADGRRLAFERIDEGDSDPGDRHRVVIIGTDGRRTVTLTPPGKQDFGPTWSPVSARLAFERWDERSGRRGVFVANSDGTGVRQLIEDAEDPSWSPDGRQVAFNRTGQGRVGIYIMNADGSGSHLVSRRFAGTIEWSPDGRSLVFVGRTPGFKFHLFVMNTNGSALQRLTRRCQQDYFPSWAPNGRKIAFACSRADADIFTVDPDGSDLRRLTSNPGTDEHPAWSPDGDWIAYVAERGDTNGVRLMRSDGSGARRITGFTHDIKPTWEPRRR